MEKGELALCYYKSPSSREKSGWIFLSDVTDVVEKYGEGRTEKDQDRDKSGISYDSIFGNGFKWIHVCHPRRTYKLRSDDVNEYNLWTKTLRQICQIGELHHSQEERGAILDLEDASSATKAKTNKTVLQPASPTYEKEHSSFTESNTTTTSIEKNHEAEIEFIREITSSKDTKAKKDVDNPFSHRKFHFHNEKLVEENGDNLDIDTYPLSYHEIITKSGIEQHTLLSKPGNGQLDFNNSPTNSNPKALMVDQHGVASIDGGEGTETHDTDTDMQQQVEGLENWKTDHRLDYSLNNSYVANETIHKRIERAILNPNIHENTSTSNPASESLNNTFDRYQSESMLKTDDKVMDSNTATITMVEELSFADDDNSERGDFVTPKSHVYDELVGMNDDNSLKNDDKMLREIQIGSDMLRKDVLSLNHNDFNNVEGESKDNIQLNENSISMMESDRFETLNKDFLMNDWDENEHESYSGREYKSDDSPYGQQPCESFDSDCSYRPDENFVEEEWD